MTANSSKLTRKMEIAAACLLTSPTISEAAKMAGISESTLLRWLKNSVFQECYREGKRAAMGAAVSSLQRASSEAANTLLEICTNKKSPASARVTAASRILEMSLKAIEIEEILTRLERLEESENVKGYY